jgi:hypothetical protein
MVQFVALQRILARNSVHTQKKTVKPIFVAPVSTSGKKEVVSLQTPFVVVSCKKNSEVRVILSKENGEARIVSK